MYWMENIVDPSAVIREEYVSFIIDTTDGRKLRHRRRPGQNDGDAPRPGRPADAHRPGEDRGHARLADLADAGRPAEDAQRQAGTRPVRVPDEQGTGQNWNEQVTCHCWRSRTWDSAAYRREARTRRRSTSYRPSCSAVRAKPPIGGQTHVIEAGRRDVVHSQLSHGPDRDVQAAEWIVGVRREWAVDGQTVLDVLVDGLRSRVHQGHVFTDVGLQRGGVVVERVKERHSGCDHGGAHFIGQAIGLQTGGSDRLQSKGASRLARVKKCNCELTLVKPRLPDRRGGGSRNTGCRCRPTREPIRPRSGSGRAGERRFPVCRRNRGRPDRSRSPAVCGTGGDGWSSTRGRGSGRGVGRNSASGGTTGARSRSGGINDGRRQRRHLRRHVARSGRQETVPDENQQVRTLPSRERDDR